MERQKRTVKDVEFLVDRLRSVFQSSVETGNPVRWSF